MKKLVVLAIAAIIGLSISINLKERTISIQKAEAGVLVVPWFFSSYRAWVSDSCSPDGFGEFLQCVLGLVFGEEDENSLDATTYLSKDHIFVTNGVKTRSGELVKYDEPTRQSHNRLQDVFVDYLEDFRDQVSDVEVKKGASVETVVADVMDEAEIVAEKFLEDKEFAKNFKSDADIQALKNFLKIQFGFKIKAKEKK